MWPRDDMEWVIDGMRYKVGNSTLLAHNWDSATMQSVYSTTFLYRTPNNRYFAVHITRIQDRPDQFEALDLEKALDLYTILRKKILLIEDAFPGVEIQNA